MTKEQAKEFSIKKMICKQSHVPFLRLIDEIYDDFDKQLKEVYIKGGDDCFKALKDSGKLRGE